MQFSFDQAYRFFQYRLPNEKVTARNALSVRCPFHPDRTPSFAINLDKAVWNCHAGCGAGGILDFERKMFPARTDDEHWRNIEKICGLEPKRSSRPLGELVATYRYVDAAGHLLAEKLRYEPKDFRWRQPDKEGWTYRVNDEAKTLYRLDELVRCNVALVAEGEKDADRLAGIDWATLALKNGSVPAVACTTAPNGAQSWREDFGQYFKGKKVFIFPDRDEAGERYLAAVAPSVAKYAYSVHVVRLDDGKDVSNYLDAHTPEEMVALIRKAEPFVKPAEDKSAPWLVPPTAMVRNFGRMEWLVPGLIHAKSRGLIVAAPKAGKSMLALDLLVALSSGQQWIGHKPLDRRVRCALIAREDPSFLTRDRAADFARARSLTMDYLGSHLLFNTRDQSQTFSLQNEEDCQRATEWIKKENIEFAVFDVLNVLHRANENSNTEMTAVMNRLAQIRDEADCALAVIHHTPHSSPERARGAGAIESWWEWRIAIAPAPDDAQVKEVRFVSKVTRPRPALPIVFSQKEGGFSIDPVAYGDC